MTQPANGTVVITAGGADLTYEPDPNYCNTQAGGSPDTFTYTLTPGGSTATVTVTVTCVDDPPIAVDDTATVVEDDPATTIDVLGNDLDIDDGPITIDQVTQPANGTVVITNGGDDLTYQPNANYCNTQAGGSPDTFTYTPGTGRLHGHRQRDGDLCGRGPRRRRRHAPPWPRTATPTTIDVLANDVDADSVGMAIDDVTQPDNGTVVVAADGADLTYEPDPNYCNTQPAGTPDTFTYTLTPGGSTATVSVTVTCVDDPPTAVERHGDGASRTQRRRRSTCWPTTPTSTADRRWSPR